MMPKHDPINRERGDTEIKGHIFANKTILRLDHRMDGYTQLYMHEGMTSHRKKQTRQRADATIHSHTHPPLTFHGTMKLLSLVFVHVGRGHPVTQTGLDSRFWSGNGVFALLRADVRLFFNTSNVFQ